MAKYCPHRSGVEWILLGVVGGMRRNWKGSKQMQGVMTVSSQNPADYTVVQCRISKRPCYILFII